jgi:hypothetical protein
MIEVLAAVAGARSVWPRWAPYGIGKRNDEARDAVIQIDIQP